MKQNIYDKVLARVEYYSAKAVENVTGKFKGVQPFDQKPIETKDLFGYYKSLSPEDMEYLIGQHGEETINDFIYTMESYAGKYQRNIAKGGF